VSFEDKTAIRINGHVVLAEVLEYDNEGKPIKALYDGVELFFSPTKQEPDRWVMAAGRLSANLARLVLRKEYHSDLYAVANSVRQRIAAGDLRTKEEVGWFILKTCEASKRVSSPPHLYEILCFTTNRCVFAGRYDYRSAAVSAFMADIYDVLGDVDKLLEEKN
jgi:hypothetical protein